MKRVKGLLASMIILTILMGSFGSLTMDLVKNDGGATTSGMITTLENPNPVRD